MAHVKLILREDVASLGNAGEVVSVKPGFARNYLLPQGKAIPATDANVSELEHHKRVVLERVTRERRVFEAQRDRLQAQLLQFTAQAGEEGKLFGSVTASQIAEQLAAKGIEIDRRKIQLEEPIRNIGTHMVIVEIDEGVHATVKTMVVEQK